MLFNLFKKKDVILEGKIYISQNSRFDIYSKTEEVSDKELILLALLVYSRYLRIETNKQEKIEVINFFENYYKEFRNSNDKKSFVDTINNIIDILSNSYNFNVDKSIFLRKVKNGNVYLDMGVINVTPFSVIVYTMFKEIWKNLKSSENKAMFLEAFLTLGKIYQTKSLTMKSAVDWPNMIVYETIPFNEPLGYEINF